MVSLVAFSSGAQDATPAEIPAPVVRYEKSKAPPKPLVPVMQNAQLVDKLKAAAANLSPPVVELVKMADSGADSTVLQAYVENSPVAYTLKAEEIIYLHEHGISTTIVTAMIQHGAKLREQMEIAQASTAAQSVQAQSPPASQATYAVDQSAPVYAASPTYAAPSSPIYFPSYSYPYGYPNYYSYPNYYCSSFPTFGFYFSRPYYYGRTFGRSYGSSFHGHFGHSFGFSHSGFHR